VLPKAGIATRLRRLTAPLLLLLLAVSASHELRAQSVEIIVNPDIASVSLDRDLLRAVFTMRLRAWPNGPPVRVFVLPDSDPVSDRFYREQLGMYSYVLRSAWDRMVYTGTGLAPTIVRSEKEMRERVRETPGAIGYVSRGRDSSMRPARPPTLLTALDGGARR
jgi:ABC-type phosphate transport system substrate-binding protein